MVYYTTFPSPLGLIHIACRVGAVTNIWLPSQRGIDLTGAVQKDDEPVLIQARDWLARYFAGEAPDIQIPLNPNGTAFQTKVWQYLSEIPYGCTTTYGTLASKFGRMSAQAVGQAVGANPIAILIPCHRVLGAGSRLAGYTGGLDKKVFLLDLEGISYKK